MGLKECSVNFIRADYVISILNIPTNILFVGKKVL